MQLRTLVKTLLVGDIMVFAHEVELWWKWAAWKNLRWHKAWVIFTFYLDIFSQQVEIVNI